MRPQAITAKSHGTRDLRRRRLAGALLVTVALGIASRRVHLGVPVWDKSLGDALYAVAVYLVFGLLRPHSQPRQAGLASLAFCLAVEVVQATGLPGRYAHLAAVRWLVGTQFAWHDIVCYCVGVAAMYLVDLRALPGNPQSPRHNT